VSEIEFECASTRSVEQVELFVNNITLHESRLFGFSANRTPCIYLDKLVEFLPLPANQKRKRNERSGWLLWTSWFMLCLDRVTDSTSRFKVTVLNGGLYAFNWPTCRSPAARLSKSTATEYGWRGRGRDGEWECRRRRWLHLARKAMRLRRVCLQWNL